jgi:hypothetical protein
MTDRNPRSAASGFAAPTAPPSAPALPVVEPVISRVSEDSRELLPPVDLPWSCSLAPRKRTEPKQL